MTLKIEKKNSAPCYAGIEIGGTKLQIVVGSAQGDIYHRYRFSVDPKTGAEGIRGHIEASLLAIKSAWEVRAIGAGYGGPVHWRTGNIIKSYHVQGWDGFPLGSWLQSVSGIPAYVENDANVAALGEALQGAGRGCDPAFYVPVGRGVGGGLVAEGRIYHGFSGGEAEIGHLRLHKDGLITEACCSGWSLDRLIRDTVTQNPTGPLAELVANAPGNEARHLGAALAQGDPSARAVLDSEASNLAHALSHVTHLFHPEIIILGGGVSLIGEPLRAAVERELRGMVMDAFQPGPRVVLAALREDAVPVGALTLAHLRFHTA